MDYHYLKAFLHVAQNKSFTAAAEKLHIAQSAVSRQITLLETHLKKQLFIRSSRKVLLTPEGEALLKQLTGFDSWLQEFSGSKHNHLRIGAPQGIIENWLIGKISETPEKELPSLTISSLSDQLISEKLHSGELDIGITSQRLESDLITARPLLHEEFVLISKSAIDLDQVDQHLWVSGHEAKYLKQLADISVKGFIRVNSISAVLKLVEKGIGIAVVPEHLLPASFKGHRQKVKMKRENLYLCIANYKYLPETIRKFIQRLND